MNLKIYAQIIINSDALDIDKPFTYEIPEELKGDIKVGQWVKVPFGMKNSIIDGFILSIKEEEITGIRIKKIKTYLFYKRKLFMQIYRCNKTAYSTRCFKGC